jgi:hypothetical protein
MRQSSAEPHIGAIQAVVIPAALFTAVVHLYLAVSPNSPQPQLRVLFFLAALGYVGAVILLYAPLGRLEPVRWLSRLALLVVTASMLIGYFVVVGFSFDTLALTDKVVEVLLGLALIADALAARAASSVRADKDTIGHRPSG